MKLFNELELTQTVLIDRIITILGWIWMADTKVSRPSLVVQIESLYRYRKMLTAILALKILMWPLPLLLIVGQLLYLSG